MATLTVNGLTFSGGVASSTGFYFSDLIDWDSLTDSKSDVNERKQAHGAFGIANDYRQSAAISFKGWFRGSDRLAMKAGKTALKRALGANRPVQATLEDVDGRTHRIVSIRSVPIDDNKASLVFKFEVDMIAPDPFAYGEMVTQSTGPAVSGGGLQWPLGTRRSDGQVDVTVPYWDWGDDGSSGRLSLTNEGSAPSWPALRADGGMSLGFIATDITTGQIVRFDRPIPDGSQVTVNQRTGTASIDGASNDVSGFLTSRDFFAIPPGETHQIQFAVLGSPSGSPLFFADLAPAYL